MKIKSKRIVKCSEPVYDMTVPECHNFLISQGIFVHNCDHPQEVIGGWNRENKELTVPGSKDCSDACAQLIYSAFITPIHVSLDNIADSVNQYHRSSITSQVKPTYFNTGKRPMSDREAMRKAMAMFNR